MVYFGLFLHSPKGALESCVGYVCMEDRPLAYQSLSAVQS